MKAFVHKTSSMRSKGKIMESENLETLCNMLLDMQDFGKFYPELVVSKPDRDHPYVEEERQCDWVVEIYDDYRE